MLVGIRVSLRAVLDLTNLKGVLTPLDLEHLLLEDWRKTNGERKDALAGRPDLKPLTRKATTAPELWASVLAA
jgi:hypothetical protein